MKTITKNKLNKFIKQSEGDWDLLLFLVDGFFKRSKKTKLGQGLLKGLHEAVDSEKELKKRKKK